MTARVAESLSGFWPPAELFMSWHWGFAFYPCNRNRKLPDRVVQDIDIAGMKARHHDSTHFDS